VVGAGEDKSKGGGVSVTAPYVPPVNPTPRPPRRFLDDDSSLILSNLLSRISGRYQKNRQMSHWYRGKEIVGSLGIGVSTEFNQLETVVGWPGTVVDKLIRRRTVDYIEAVGSDEMTERIAQVCDVNEFALESRMLHTDKSVHGVAFNVTASNAGQTIILPTPATRMTCDYDRASRTVTAAASWDPPSSDGGNRQATLYLPNRTYVVEQYGGRYLIVNDFENTAGVVPVDRFVNRPWMGRLWGSSNITPAVLSITKRTVRTLMATEVMREFFAAPMRYALNMDPDAFTDANGDPIPAWETYWGKFIAAVGAENESGELAKPEIGQLPASSPAPLIDLIKMDSQLLATEVGMPPSMFGFVTENPPSGDALKGYESDMEFTAKQDNATDGVGWASVARKILLAEGYKASEIPPIRTVWKSVSTETPAATTDSVVKQVAAGILPPDSDITREKLGYSREESKRIAADLRRQRSRDLVAAVAQRADAARQDPQVTDLAAQRGVAG
jgi:hypothetical protein